MSDYFHCHYSDGQHRVCMTSNGLDHMPVPRAVFPTPRQAIAYASMREAAVSPLRAPVEGSARPPAEPSAGSLTGA